MHTSYKILTINMLTSNGNKNSMVYPRLPKAGFYYLSKKLFLLMQKQITLIESIAALATICIVTLLILANLAQSYRKTNIEPAASLRYALPKYAPVARAVAPEIMPRVPMSGDQMEDVRRELDKRRRWVASVCETIDTKRSHSEITLANIIIDMEHNVSWCPIYKAASSTWMKNFAVLKGTLTDITINLIHRNLTQISDIVRQKFQQDADFTKTYEKMSRTKKFLIVRHPLERLLSAYRDKLEHIQNREYYYKRFGRRIVLKYRQSNNTTRLEPTFAEFLRFIVNEKYFDEHWAPYYRTCEPCTVHYDYILKFETLDRDQDFFIQNANLSRYLYEENYENYPRNINPLGATTRKTLDKYIKGISRSLLDKIYKIYENDYKLFNYTSV